MIPMTPFQAVWSPQALHQLAALWNTATKPVRLEITRAQHRIDRALAQDPKSAGHELSEGLWKIQDPPLLAFFEMNEVHRILRVTDVYFS
jgi:hypothetical protein